MAKLILTEIFKFKNTFFFVFMIELLQCDLYQIQIVEFYLLKLSSSNFLA